MGAADLAELLGAVESTLGDTVVRYTERRGHARELAAEGVRDGHPLVIAVGGDGTFSEVVDGLLTESTKEGATTAQDSPAVGLVDAGTGGDFRRNLGVEPGWRHCLDAIALGRERLIDAGNATFKGVDGSTAKHHFVNVLSAGLGGLAVRYVATAPAFLGGSAAYYLASLRAAALGREYRVSARITFEGETREEIIPAYLIAICNGGWFGGGMNIAPMALIDDGRLEVLTITERNRFTLAAKIRKVYPGRHLELPTVHSFPCQRIELWLEKEDVRRRFLLDVDGEYLGSPPLAVDILPKRLRLRA